MYVRRYSNMLSLLVGVQVSTEFVMTGLKVKYSTPATATTVTSVESSSSVGFVR